MSRQSNVTTACALFSFCEEERRIRWPDFSIVRFHFSVLGIPSTSSLASISSAKKKQKNKIFGILISKLVVNQHQNHFSGGKTEQKNPEVPQCPRRSKIQVGDNRFISPNLNSSRTSNPEKHVRYCENHRNDRRRVSLSILQKKNNSRDSQRKFRTSVFWTRGMKPVCQYESTFPNRHIRPIGETGEQRLNRRILSTSGKDVGKHMREVPRIEARASKGGQLNLAHTRSLNLNL